MKKLVVFILFLVGVGVLAFHNRVQKDPPEVSVEPQKAQEAVVEKPAVLVTPAQVTQGEPAVVALTGAVGTSSVSSLTFQNKPLGAFRDREVYKAFVGVDLHLAPGSYPVTAELGDGEKLETKLVVKARKVETAPLGIPESLGGNTPQSEKQLINTLVEEGKIIDAIKTSGEKLWSGAFVYPLTGPITITDPYGYSRETGSSNLSHKGTDFRAAVGTPVVAINSGKVAYTGYLRNYGNVIAIDHGLGLLSIYMHLSEIDVKVGDSVKKSQVIAKSGATGYVLGAHLHLTIRINNISIDPIKFFELMGS